MPTFIKPGFWNKKRKQLAGELDLDKLVRELLPPPITRNYEYSVRLTQTGTNDPIQYVYTNNTDGTVSWVRQSTGVYLGTYSGGDISILNFIPIITQSGITTSMTLVNGKIRITTNQSGPLADNVLNNSFYSFRIYSY
jgi:hypothetical protein